MGTDPDADGPRSIPTDERPRVDPGSGKGEQPLASRDHRGAWTSPPRDRIPPPASARGRHRLAPRGVRDLVLQIVVWSGFAAAYESVRGLTAGDRAAALDHAHSLIRLEQRLHIFVEPELQRHLAGNHVLAGLADWTYWLAQFVLVGTVIVVVYFRSSRAYRRLRDRLIITNCIGLIGYLIVPLAPPRLVPGYGFRDTFGAFWSPTTHNGLIHLFANPYAAFPSVHEADALILGLSLAGLTRRPMVRAAALLWPPWVAFALVLSGNHFWLDVVAGVATALVGWVGAAGARRWFRVAAVGGAERGSRASP